jgi:hypothetical protein
MGNRRRPGKATAAAVDLGRQRGEFGLSAKIMLPWHSYCCTLNEVTVLELLAQGFFLRNPRRFQT